MSKRYSGKSFKDSSVMKKSKLSLKEKRKLKKEKKNKKWISKCIRNHYFFNVSSFTISLIILVKIFKNR